MLYSPSSRLGHLHWSRGVRFPWSWLVLPSAVVWDLRLTVLYSLLFVIHGLSSEFTRVAPFTICFDWDEHHTAFRLPESGRGRRYPSAGFGVGFRHGSAPSAICNRLRVVPRQLRIAGLQNSGGE